MTKTINGETIREMLDDYAGRHYMVEQCDNEEHDRGDENFSCPICDEDIHEMEKIILKIELAL